MDYSEFMCGRISQHQPSRYADMFVARQAALLLPSRYNVAPSLPVAACREASRGGREMVNLLWGFVPHWAKEATGLRPINARAETLFTKGLFREAARQRRCLVPADGFYEWLREGKGKQPYFVRFKNRDPFALAGIWDCHGEEGEVAGNCTVVVTEPNAVVSPLHDRMPVIVSSHDYALWLDRGVHDPARLQPLLVPFAAEEMEAIRVSRAVNKPGVEGPQLVAPVESESGR